jgi:hypothetical protein
MASDHSGHGKPYREKLYDAAINLHKNLRYMVFVYIVGIALAGIALGATSGGTRSGLSLSFVLAAYGIAALALAIFTYAVVQLTLLAFCAYAEWLCEQHGAKCLEDRPSPRMHEVAEQDTDDSDRRHPADQISLKCGSDFHSDMPIAVGQQRTDTD